MVRFLFRRLLQALIAIAGVLTLIFFLLELSGDPVLLMVPVGASPEDIDAVRRSLGLEQPLVVRYIAYLGGLLRFDLGRSVTQNIPVLEIIASRLPYTLRLASVALLLAIGGGVALGIVAAVQRGTALARLLSGLLVTGQSLPTFWSGILLILLFAVQLGWLPPSGAQERGAVLLPALSLGFVSMATFARITRAAFVEELSKDYVRTARSKGIGTWRIVLRHVFRNASIPIVTVGALEVATLLTGAVVVETVFAWPGLGQVTTQALAARDFPVVQGVVLFGAFAAISLNFLADVLYSAIDPRIRLAGEGA